MSGGVFTRHEQKATGLYAVLARDACDFLDMLNGEEIETLQCLHEMLTLRRSGDAETDFKLNELGARFVRSALERKGAVPRFAAPELPNFED